MTIHPDQHNIWPQNTVAKQTNLRIYYPSNIRSLTVEYNLLHHRNKAISDTWSLEGYSVSTPLGFLWRKLTEDFDPSRVHYFA